MVLVVTAIDGGDAVDNDGGNIEGQRKREDKAELDQCVHIRSIIRFADGPKSFAPMPFVFLFGATLCSHL